MPIGGNNQVAQAGDVKFWPASSAPAGWLKANGAAVSRSTYAALFAIIGTTYGAGDGATTFGLPDLRGEFLRGWDDSRGVDVSRTLGSAQTHLFASHSHQIPNNGATLDVVSGNLRFYYDSGSYPGGLGVQNTGGNETRPRNVAMLACIKY